MMALLVGNQKIAKVVVTRSRKGNAELASKLTKLGLEVVSVDTLEFLPPGDWSPVDRRLNKLCEFDWLLITSATGAAFFTHRMKMLSLPLGWRGKPLVGVVGEKTGAALREEGTRVAFAPSKFLTEALADELPRNRGKKVLILRADIGDPGLASKLRQRGFKVEDLAVYRTSEAPGASRMSDGALAGAEAVIFASPSAVEALATRISAFVKERLVAFCIGPVTARRAKALGFERVVTARIHTLDGILERLAESSPSEEP